MIVGVPKEIKDNEYRVSMTPGGIHQLVEHGHTVLVETKAGEGSHFSDEDFTGARAKITSAEEVWSQANMIVKVKEPLAAERRLLGSTPGHAARRSASGLERRIAARQV